MSTRKISELTPSGALTGAELVEVVQSGGSARSTTADLGNAATNSVKLTGNQTNIAGTKGFSGLVGISTSAPLARLHVSSSSQINSPTLGSINSAVPLFISNSDPGYGLAVGMDAVSRHAWIQAQRVDGVATASNIVLNPLGGNVSIGTSTPADALHVNRSTVQTTYIRLSNNNATSAFGSGGGNFTEIVNLTGGSIDFYTSGALRQRITASGNTGFGGVTGPTAAIDNNGFSKLGEQAPKIKQKKLTGTTSGSTSTSVSVAHGLTRDKIIGYTFHYTSAGGSIFPHNRDDTASLLVTTSIDATNLVVSTGPSTTTGLGRPFVCLITYEE